MPKFYRPLLSLAMLLGALAGVPTVVSAQANKALPALAESRPANEATGIDEAQVFLVRAKGPITSKAFIERVFCEVEGVRSVNTVQVIGGKRRSELLQAAGISNEENWVAFRCAQNFPVDADVIVRWDSPSATTFQAADYLRFKVRAGDWLTLNCSRENKDTGCNPLAPITVSIDRAIDSEDLAKFRLRDEKGKLYSPEESEYGEYLEFKGLPRLTRFTLIVPPGLKEAGTETALILKKTFTLRTDDYPPLIKFSRSFGILERNAEPVLPMTVRNLEADREGKGTAAVIRSLRLTSDTAMIDWYGRALALQRADRSMNDDESDYTNVGEGTIRPKRAEDEDLRARSLLKAEPQATQQALPKPGGAKEFEVVGLPLPQPGLYVIEAESTALGASLLEKKQPMYVRTVALVTNLAVHVKTGSEQAFVWVTQLDNASVVPQAQIRIRDCKGKDIATAQTGAQGSATLSIAKFKQNYDCPLFVFAQSGDDLAFTRSDWSEGIEAWRFNLPWAYEYGDEKTTGINLHTVLARNLLRPGETVHMKHYARSRQRLGTAAPNAAQLPKNVVVVNEGNNERSTLQLQWSARGNALTELRLPANAKRGQYRLEMAGRTTGRFTVADFRLPVYKAEVSMMQPDLVGGETAHVDVRLSFLSGGPAGGDVVKLRSRIDGRYWAGFEAWSDYSFSTYDEESSDRGGRQPAGDDVEAALSNAGTVRLDVPTKPVNKVHTLIADVEYSDPNGEIYTAQTRGTLWPAATLVGVRVSEWAMAREQLRYDIVTTDVQGKAVANVPFKVKGQLERWDMYRKRNIGGFYSYESNVRQDDLGVLCEGVTDRQGRFTCTSAVKVSGEVKLVAEVSDSKGRLAQGGSSVWAANGDDWIFRAASSDRIDLLPEKKKYAPGESARFQVRMPFREANALITVEREGRVLSSFVTKLSGKSAVVDVPIKAEWAPNVYVSALLVRGRVGEPAPTAMVDLARPAFKLGVANVDVNWPRYSLDVAVTPDKTVYQTRDVAAVKVKVLQSDSKRAAANTELAVFAIDEALLELQGNETWQLLDAMMKRRSYEVNTATAQMQVIGKRHFGRKALPPGGSGGRGSGTRELFDTLLLWQGTLQTDANGEAQFEVPLNDSLTRFRIVAVADNAATDGDRFGTGDVSIRSTRDVQLFSGLPATVRQGDQFRAAVTLRNTTERSLVAEVSADLNGTALPRQEKRLAAGESTLVYWDIKAPDKGQQAVWNFAAIEKGKRRGDALRIRQNLESPFPIRTVADASGEIKGSLNLTLKPEMSFIPGTQPELQVSVARVYGSETSGIREYFERYPFACLEQRMSKALGTNKAELWQIIAGSLPNYLSSSGLANYYPGDSQEGSPTLTAFVLSGAHEAGWELPEAARERMLYALERHVAGNLEARRAWLPNDSYYLLSEKLISLEALSRYGRASKRLLDTIRVDPVKLTAASLADWLEVLNRTPDIPNRDALRAAAIRELRDNIKLSANVASIARSDDRWYFMRSDSYTMARMFRLSLQTKELAEYKLPLLRSLNNQMRRGGYFGTTQANLWAAFAMERYSKEASADGRTRISFGDQTQEVVWDAGTLEGQAQFVWPQQASGTVSFTHLGKGTPWTRAQVRGAIPLSGQVNNGIALSKTMTPVIQKTPGRYSVGDVIRVTVTADNGSNIGWMAIDDAVPAGATVLGGLSRLATVSEEARSWQGYRYVERTFTNVRASFEWATKGKHSFSYELRLTTPGRYALPPTHAEAMYIPEVNGQLGNADFEILP